MSNKIFFGLFFYLSFQLSIFAQVATTTNGQLVGDVENEARPGAMLAQIPMLSPKTKGNSYLDDKWMMGSVEFYGGQSFKNHLMRYDIGNKSLELKINDKIKSVDDKFIKTLNNIDLNSGEYRYYINSKEFVLKEGEFNGLLRVMNYVGYWNLVIITKLDFIEANYNATLDTGNNVNKIIKKEIYYINNGNSLELLERKRKVFFNQFGVENTEEIKYFVKTYQLNTTKLEDIKKIIVYANSIENRKSN